MGILLSCCNKKRSTIPEERVPLRSNKVGMVGRAKNGLLTETFSLENQDDDYFVDPEIQKFLGNLSTDDDDGLNDDDFESIIDNDN